MRWQESEVDSGIAYGRRERLIDEYDQILGAKKDVINVLPGVSCVMALPDVDRSPGFARLTGKVDEG